MHYYNIQMDIGRAIKFHSPIVRPVFVVSLKRHAIVCPLHGIKFHERNHGYVHENMVDVQILKLRSNKFFRSHVSTKFFNGYSVTHETAATFYPV